MNLYFIEILAKERQQQIAEEFKRIHTARAARNSADRMVGKVLLKIRAMLFPVQTRMQNLCRPSMEPALGEYDAISTQR